MSLLFFGVFQPQAPGRLVPGMMVGQPFVDEKLKYQLVTALDGLVPRRGIYLASALLFGIPHFFGVPGGALGSLMAGFLGWLLAKSIAETEGLGWAWFIHFLQDVVIFGGLFWAAL